MKSFVILALAAGLLHLATTSEGQQQQTYGGPVVYSNLPPPVLFFPNFPDNKKEAGGDTPKKVEYVPFPYKDLPLLVYQSEDQPPVHVVENQDPQEQGPAVYKISDFVGGLSGQQQQNNKAAEQKQQTEEQQGVDEGKQNAGQYNNVAQQQIAEQYGIVAQQQQNEGQYGNVAQQQNAGQYNNVAQQQIAEQYGIVAQQQNAGQYNNMVKEQQNGGQYGNVAHQQQNERQYEKVAQQQNAGQYNNVAQQQIAEQYGIVAQQQQNEGQYNNMVQQQQNGGQYGNVAHQQQNEGQYGNGAQQQNAGQYNNVVQQQNGGQYNNVVHQQQIAGQYNNMVQQQQNGGQYTNVAHQQNGGQYVNAIQPHESRGHYGSLVHQQQNGGQYPGVTQPQQNEGPYANMAQNGGQYVNAAQKQNVGQYTPQMMAAQVQQQQTGMQYGGPILVPVPVVAPPGGGGQYGIVGKPQYGGAFPIPVQEQQNAQYAPQLYQNAAQQYYATAMRLMQPPPTDAQQTQKMALVYAPAQSLSPQQNAQGTHHHQQQQAPPNLRAVEPKAQSSKEAIYPVQKNQPVSSQPAEEVEDEQQVLSIGVYEGEEHEPQQMFTFLIPQNMQYSREEEKGHAEEQDKSPEEERPARDKQPSGDQKRKPQQQQPPAVESGTKGEEEEVEYKHILIHIPHGGESPQISVLPDDGSSKILYAATTQEEEEEEGGGKYPSSSVGEYFRPEASRGTRKEYPKDPPSDWPGQKSKGSPSGGGRSGYSRGQPWRHEHQKAFSEYPLPAHLRPEFTRTFKGTPSESIRSSIRQEHPKVFGDPPPFKLRPEHPPRVSLKRPPLPAEMPKFPLEAYRDSRRYVHRRPPSHRGGGGSDHVAEGSFHAPTRLHRPPLVLESSNVTDFEFLDDPEVSSIFDPRGQNLVGDKPVPFHHQGAFQGLKTGQTAMELMAAPPPLPPFPMLHPPVPFRPLPVVPYLPHNYHLSGGPRFLPMHPAYNQPRTPNIKGQRKPAGFFRKLFTSLLGGGTRTPLTKREDTPSLEVNPPSRSMPPIIVYQGSRPPVEVVGTKDDIVLGTKEDDTSRRDRTSDDGDIIEALLSSDLDSIDKSVNPSHKSEEDDILDALLSDDQTSPATSSEWSSSLKEDLEQLVSLLPREEKSHLLAP